MKMIFTVEQFKKNMGHAVDVKWIFQCDGKMVDIDDKTNRGYIGECAVHRDWCRPFTMQDFISKKIAVTFANADEQKRFLQECERAGLPWENGEKATDVRYDFSYPTSFTYFNALGYWSAGASDANRDGFAVVPFSHFDFSASSLSDYSLTISCKDGKTTESVYSVDGKEVRKAKAVKNDKDAFDFKAAAYLAGMRALGENPKRDKPVVGVRGITSAEVKPTDKPDCATCQTKQERDKFYAMVNGYDKPDPNPAPKPDPQYREVKRKAEKGDRIRITKPFCDRFKAGEEYTVKSATGSGLVLNENPTILYETEYVVLEPIKPAPWRPAVGDLVYIKGNPMFGEFDAGSIVKVETICISGHSRARDKSGKIVCLLPGAILPVREEDRPAKVGEWVETLVDSKHDDFNGNLRYHKGDILHITDCIPEKENWWHKKGVRYDHPACKHFVIENNEYRVLVPYDPTEAAK
jgi:hypothetical protein